MYYCYIKKLVSLLQYIGQIYQDNNTLASLKLWKLFGAFQALLGIYKKTFFKYPPGWRFCGIWQDNGYIQKKHVQIPWSAWIFYEIPHSAGYMAKNPLQIPTETIFYAIFSTTQGIELKFFSIYPEGS